MEPDIVSRGASRRFLHEIWQNEAHKIIFVPACSNEPRRSTPWENTNQALARGEYKQQNHWRSEVVS